MKKVLTLLLVLALAVSLCACASNAIAPGAGKKEADLIGKWTGKVDLLEVLEATGQAEGMEDVFDGIDMKITFEFDEDGECAYTMHMEDALDDIVDNIESNPRVLVNVLKDSLQEQGMSEADFESQMGMSLKEYVEKLCQSGDIYDFFEGVQDTTVKADYEVKDDELHLIDGEDEECITFELEDDEMTFKKYTFNGEDSDDGKFLEGLELKRK